MMVFRLSETGNKPSSPVLPRTQLGKLGLGVNRENRWRAKGYSEHEHWLRYGLGILYQYQPNGARSKINKRSRMMSSRLIPPAGAVTPLPAIGPGRQAAHEQENQDDQQQQSHDSL